MGGSYPGQEEADAEIFMPVMTELEPLFYITIWRLGMVLMLISSLLWTHFWRDIQAIQKFVIRQS